MIPLWTVPLLLAAILTILGWIGARWRSRKHTGRTRPDWDVPDGVTAQDVAALYAQHPANFARIMRHEIETLRKLAESL